MRGTADLCTFASALATDSEVRVPIHHFLRTRARSLPLPTLILSPLLLWWWCRRERGGGKYRGESEAGDYSRVMEAMKGE